MKLYIEDIDLVTIKPDNIYAYIQKKSNRDIIYCENGIYKVNKNKIYKIHFNDSPIYSKTFNEMPFLIDDSTTRTDEEQFQIPRDHTHTQYTDTTYVLRPKAMLQLVITTKKHMVEDMYFQTELDINSIGLKDDIFSFLSLLKFNNKV